MSTLVVTNLSLGAGGLPNGSVLTDDIADGAITSAKVASAAVTAEKLDGDQSGSAPIYGARAWVNFNGTGAVTIRSSGNVTSIGDNGTGAYTMNFTTAMSDANYAVVATSGDGASTNYRVVQVSDATAPTTLAVRVQTLTQNSGNPSALDHSRISIAIFR